MFLKAQKIREITTEQRIKSYPSCFHEKFQVEEHWLLCWFYIYLFFSWKWHWCGVTVLQQRRWFHVISTIFLVLFQSHGTVTCVLMYTVWKNFVKSILSTFFFSKNVTFTIYFPQKCARENFSFFPHSGHCVIEITERSWQDV